MKYWSNEDTKPMTREEERVAFLCYQEGVQSALNDICRANHRFVKQMVQKYLYAGLDFDTLQSAALTGMIEAANRFNPSAGFKFISYAVWWIRQAIYQELNTNRLVQVPTTTSRAMSHFSRIDGNALTGLAQEDVPANIRDAVLVATMRPVSLDAPNDYTNGEGIGSRTFSDNSYEKIESVAEAEATQRDIAWALGQLPEREQIVVGLYFGTGCDHPMTLDEIGNRLGVTRERVRQIKERAIRKMSCNRRLEIHWQESVGAA